MYPTLFIIGLPVILLSYFYARALGDLEHQMCSTHLFLFTKVNFFYKKTEFVIPNRPQRHVEACIRVEGYNDTESG